MCIKSRLKYRRRTDVIFFPQKSPNTSSKTGSFRPQQSHQSPCSKDRNKLSLQKHDIFTLY
jgi:hypothetical protein